MAPLKNALKNILKTNKGCRFGISGSLCDFPSDAFLKTGTRNRSFTITFPARLDTRLFTVLRDKVNKSDERFSDERFSDERFSDKRFSDERFPDERENEKGATNDKSAKDKSYETNKKHVTNKQDEENETMKKDEQNEETYKIENVIEKKENEEINYEKMNKIDLINEIKKTKKYINEKNLDNKILKEKYLSVLAENENLRNRYLKEIENSKIYCITNFAKSLLDVADNLSLAIQNINEESLKKNEEINNIHKGIQMTETILHNIFNNYGINKYNPINEKFNPLLHEAIYEINDVTKEKGTVATVIQHGYKIKDRILRAAKVGVVKN